MPPFAYEPFSPLEKDSKLPFLKLPASLPLKINGWKTTNFPFGKASLFSGVNSLLIFGGVKVIQPTHDNTGQKRS